LGKIITIMPKTRLMIPPMSPRLPIESKPGIDYHLL
jgi:hypothetical protein